MSNREVIIPKGMEVLYERYHYCPGIKIGNTLDRGCLLILFQ